MQCHTVLVPKIDKSGNVNTLREQMSPASCGCFLGGKCDPQRGHSVDVRCQASAGKCQRNEGSTREGIRVSSELGRALALLAFSTCVTCWAAWIRVSR